MISRAEVEDLLKRSRGEGKTLSLYLDLNSADFGEQNRKPATELNSLVHDLKRRIPQGEHDELLKNAEAAERVLYNGESGGKGLVVFVNAKENFVWSRRINAAVKQRAFWAERPEAVPLLEIMSDHERVGVILVDRVRIRIVYVEMGELHGFKTFENADHKDVQRTQTTGTDHLRSQMQHQRQADTHAHWHFREAAEAVIGADAKHDFRSLVLGGQSSSIAQFEKMLPKQLQEKIIGRCSLSIYAKNEEILQEAAKIQQSYDALRKKSYIQNLITLAHKRDKAVLGLDAVSSALSNGQIQTLVYTRSIETKIREISEKVLTAGGKIEEVQGSAAEILDREGGVGAYLRFSL